MREAIGGTWITQLVIVFMFVFVAFLALSMNYSKSFRIKNEVLSFVEKNEGITSNTVERINNYLVYTGYSTKGNCDVGMYGIGNLNGSSFQLVTDSTKTRNYYYCIGKVKSTTTNFQNRSYYRVKLFFKFNLPIIGDISTFKIDGQTKDVIYPADGNCKNNQIQCMVD